MKKSLFAIACAALVSASTAFAEGGMFEGYLPEDWKENGKADVVAAIKYTRMDFHNWKQESGTSSSTWLVTYDADLKIPFSILDWSSKINLAIGQTWTDGFGRDSTLWDPHSGCGILPGCIARNPEQRRIEREQP